ncbi:hypothetical protein [Desulfitobacterium sp. AusDCA]|uniref:hypothetical protein n=1 Tax=Desulfitobacterium sp. AusDCA TaxID=3240383 RepID=UPI003DA7051D
MLLIFSGIIIGFTTRTGFSLGDRIFLDLGISPWSNSQTGFHNTIVISLVLFLIGGIEARRVVSRRKLFILIILLMLLTPTVLSLIKPVYFGIHSGLASIEYESRISHFDIRSSEDNKNVEVIGSIILTNHGKKPIRVGIKIPADDRIHREWLLHDLVLLGVNDSEEPGTFILPPGETENILTFTTIPSENGYNGRGLMNGPNLILFTDDETRLVGHNL